MRQLPALILGFILLATQARSATDSPSEVEIEAKINAVRQQQNELRIREQHLNKELDEAKQRSFGGIHQAEVTGILKQSNAGRYILMRGAKGEEQRVWLRPITWGTNLQADQLIGHEVRANGQLHIQGKTTPPAKYLDHPEPVQTTVPENGLYLERFGIQELRLEPVVPPVVPSKGPPLLPPLQK
jgi:hypothetical protein